MSYILRLSRIKRSQVKFMGKFGPTVLNFGLDLVIFLGHPVYVQVDHGICIYVHIDIDQTQIYLLMEQSFFFLPELVADLGAKLSCLPK